jgi:hypothetical protein
MVGEVFAAVGGFKALLDIAKALKDMNDATVRNAAVIELQEKILAAQEAQTELLERVHSLETEVAKFEEWDTKKEQYELNKLAPQGIFAYSTTGADIHWICPDCYEDRRRSILQPITRNPGLNDIRLCQRCGWEAYVEGVWRPEHRGSSASRRK